MSIPILGQSVTKVPAQARLNAKTTAESMIAEWRSLGLKHGRSESALPTGVDPTGILLVIDAMHELGCIMIGATEVLITQNGQPTFIIHLFWRLPPDPSKIQ